MSHLMKTSHAFESRCIAEGEEGKAMWARVLVVIT